ncbi:MAG: twin transmembrane helix small protein [Burkholderiaceae bacterium]
MSKLFIAVAFAGILMSLGSAFFYLMRDKGRSNKTVKALAFRVGLSILLFLSILVAHQLGWIESTGVRY